MTGLASDLRRRARIAVRAAALNAAGVVFSITGLAFLTVALWVLIATYQSSLAAWTVLGLLYLSLGCCFLLLAGRSRPPARQTTHATAPPAQPVEPFLRMAEAFAMGLQSGRRSRNPRR